MYFELFKWLSNRPIRVRYKGHYKDHGTIIRGNGNSPKTIYLQSRYLSLPYYFAPLPLWSFQLHISPWENQFSPSVHLPVLNKPSLVAHLLLSLVPMANELRLPINTAWHNTSGTTQRSRISWCPTLSFRVAF